MITSKQRAYLRKLSHELEPIFQIGKDGVSKVLIEEIGKALDKREIVKVHILESALLGTRETCDEIAKELGAESVQAIGNKFTLYRESSEEKNRKIELPKR